MNSLKFVSDVTMVFAVLTIFCMIFNIGFTLRQKRQHPSLIFGMGFLTITTASGIMAELIRQIHPFPPLSRMILFMLSFTALVLSMTINYYFLWKQYYK